MPCRLSVASGSDGSGAGSSRDRRTLRVAVRPSEAGAGVVAVADETGGRQKRLRADVAAALPGADVETARKRLEDLKNQPRWGYQPKEREVSEYISTHPTADAATVSGSAYSSKP